MAFAFDTQGGLRRWTLTVPLWALLAATPTIRLAVETIPSFAPSTAARSQPIRSTTCRSGWCEIIDMAQFSGWCCDPQCLGYSRKAIPASAPAMPRLWKSQTRRPRASKG